MVLSKKFKMLLKGLIFGLFLFFILSCEEVDDQTIATNKEWQAANPLPTTRDFKRINQQHKILVAVIDSGVDYNQPNLVNNIHFDLDTNGSPKSFGYDFVGEDNWASPYVARTLDFNPQANKEDSNESRLTRNKAWQLIKIQPQLAPYLDPSRNVEQEIDSGAYHGTHVAGLISYDQPEIGVLAYRVLPVNIKYEAGRRVVKGSPTEAIFNNILKAMSLAISQGARVINMSLVLKPNDNVLFGGSESNQNQYKEWIQKVKKYMEMNPYVVFVAAAGNEGRWVDDVSNLQLPCGISAKNLVCVGALNEDNSLAAFSNIVLSESAFVMTSGVKVNSLYPVKMCDSSHIAGLNLDLENKSKFIEVAGKILTDCKGKIGFYKSTGTSMSSPIVARQIAKVLIKNPALSGVDAIQQLLDQSEVLKKGPLTFHRVKFEKPSWSLY